SQEFCKNFIFRLTQKGSIEPTAKWNSTLSVPTSKTPFTAWLCRLLLMVISDSEGCSYGNGNYFMARICIPGSPRYDDGDGRRCLFVFCSKCCDIFGAFFPLLGLVPLATLQAKLEDPVGFLMPNEISLSGNTCRVYITILQNLLQLQFEWIRKMTCSHRTIVQLQ
ncbi:unnamed protein product, partial [Allacma fusca]